MIGLLACAACERQDFTGPLIFDAAPADDEASTDAGVDAPADVAEAAVDAPPDAPPPIPTSCKDAHARDPAAASGLFTIDTDGAGTRAPFAVQCDMTTEGGGWTLIARSVSSGDAGASGPFGWTATSGSPTSLDAPYSLSPRAAGLSFKRVLVGARVASPGSLDWLFVYDLPIDAAFVDAHAASSASVEPVAVKGCGAGVPSFLRHAGYTAREDSFFFRDSDDSAATSGLTAGGWVFAGVAPPDGVGCATYGGLYGQQGLVMVR